MKTYFIYKKTNNATLLFKSVSNENGHINLQDYDIFKYDEIEYYVASENGEILTDFVKIRPKDYLINTLNNELVSTKKKWYV